MKGTDLTYSLCDARLLAGNAIEKIELTVLPANLQLL